MKYLLAFPIAASACLSVPEGPTPECESTDDCDRAHGEVCEEGVCWGNPPAGPFAAVVSPSADINDLVAREIRDLPIPDYGWIGDIALDEPVTYNAVIHTTCSTGVDCSLPYSATISITRPSLFPGGPGFKDEITVDAGAPGFRFAVPRTRPVDPPYVITIAPADRNDPGAGTNAIVHNVPPFRFTVAVPDNVNGKTLEVGAQTTPTIDGVVQTAAGVGVGEYRVVALGHWDPEEPLREVSTVDYTSSDGKYSLRLATGLVGPVEVVAKPYGSRAQFPALHVANVPSDTAANRVLQLPANLGAQHSIDVRVTAVDGSGGVMPVVGARVILSGVVTGQQVGAFATLGSEGSTNGSGVAKVTMFDGPGVAADYRISIVPPASSEAGVIFDEKLDLGKLDKLLPTRVALRGVVRTVSGDPAGEVTVTARPSLRFQWSLLDAQQAFLTAIPQATTTTPDTGEFVLFVDPLIADVWGNYDLVFEPSAKLQRAPSFERLDFALPRDSSADVVAVPDVVLPDAAFVHGRVTDPGGNPVKGAELKLFRVDLTTKSLCAEVSHAPASCPVQARLLGLGASDSDGTVRLTLPR